MQRRHFEALAQCLRETREALKNTESLMGMGYEKACQNMEDAMVRTFRAANPNFRAETFREACKPGTAYRNKSDNRSL